MNTKSVKYWKPFLGDLPLCRSFDDVGFIGESVVKSMPEPSVGLTAPLTTGGFGLEINTKIVEESILKLESYGFHVFNFLPLSIGLIPLIENWKRDNTGYCIPIINVTYGRIFKSRKLEIIFSIPRKKKSIGADREKEILLELGIPILNFPVGWYWEILLNLGIKKNSEVVIF
jgi:hypothetical protein